MKEGRELESVTITRSLSLLSTHIHTQSKYTGRQISNINKPILSRTCNVNQNMQVMYMYMYKPLSDFHDFYNCNRQ